MEFAPSFILFLKNIWCFWDKFVKKTLVKKWMISASLFKSKAYFLVNEIFSYVFIYPIRFMKLVSKLNFYSGNALYCVVNFLRQFLFFFLDKSTCMLWFSQQKCAYVVIFATCARMLWQKCMCCDFCDINYVILEFFTAELTNEIAYFE